LILVMAPAAGVAGDIPKAVKVACSNDYQKHCIKHVPGSDAGRECMADVFEKLSETCVAAIMNSDLVGEEPDREAAETAVAETATPPVPDGGSRHAGRRARRGRRGASPHRDPEPGRDAPHRAAPAAATTPRGRAASRTASLAACASPIATYRGPSRARSGIDGVNTESQE
jgi:hypothetical protein